MPKNEQVNEIQLGDIARDTITGYEGKVVGVTDWLYQCRRIGLQSMKLDKDGGPRDIEWFDELQCSLMENIPVISRDDNGGPMPTPTRNQDP